MFLLFKLFGLLYYLRALNCDDKLGHIHYFLTHLNPNHGGAQNCECPLETKCEYGTGTLPSMLQNEADICFPNPKPCDPNNIYYTFDGSCNNLEISHWGQANTAFIRLLPANYSDGISRLRVAENGSPLPHARKIRTTLLPDGDIYASDINVFFYGFGQFVDHDVSRQSLIHSPVKCCENGKPPPIYHENVCLPTIIPPNDYFYSQFGVTCTDLKRAVNTGLLGCNIKPVGQINHQTAFIDLSFIYGTSFEQAQSLRTHVGGFLKTSEGPETNFQSFPAIASGPQACPTGGIDIGPGAPCFVTGDGRINQNPELLASAVIFIRLHNYLAANLHIINPFWNDEQLFQEARRIAIAMYQHVTYAEYLPILIGPTLAAAQQLFPATQGYVNKYNPKLNPQTFGEYAAAAGRSQHSNIVGHVSYEGPAGTPSSYLLRNTFFNLKFFFGKDVFRNIIKAYTAQACQRQDQFFNEEITNWLFDSINAPYGLDLPSIDINRGRDYGLPNYNDFRQACGLCRLHSFHQLGSYLRNPEDTKKFESVYESLNDIDYYVAAQSEKPIAGATVGATFACVLAESFVRWKFGDRFYYEFPSAKFTPAQLQSIRTTTISEILCITTPDLEYIQKNGFLKPSLKNPIVPCSQIPKINLNLWKI